MARFCQLFNVAESWRPRPESNRSTRICNPLRNHSATRPLGRLIWGLSPRVKIGLHTQSDVCAKLVHETFALPFPTLGLPVWALLVLLAAGCGVLFHLTVSGRFGVPGALIFVFAAGASINEAAEFSVVIERTAATAIAAALAWLICASTEFLRHKATPEGPFLSEPVEPLSERLAAALRISLGAGAAIFASRALGDQHPAWAAMGALAVMQGARLHISMNRALQRVAGTVIGALLAWLVLMFDPSIWTVVAILLGLQIATEMIIGSNYGLGQILVTPMALLMTYLATPGAAGAALVPERVIDTLLGATIGISAAVLFSSARDRQALAHHHSSRGKE